METAKIIKIGTFNSNGFPDGWHVSDMGAENTSQPVLEIKNDGRVLVGGVEVVEWTEARKNATNKSKK